MKKSKNNELKNEIPFPNNPEMTEALNIIKDTNDNLMINGREGSGKSRFINYLVRERGVNVGVIVPRIKEVANLNSYTLPSYFKYPSSTEKYISRRNNERPILKIIDRIKCLDILIINDISMLDARVMDALSTYLQEILEEKNLPFGGKRVLLVGNHLGLPPDMRLDAAKDIEGVSDDFKFFEDSEAYKDLQYFLIDFRTESQREYSRQWMEANKDVRIEFDPEYFSDLKVEFAADTELESKDGVDNILHTKEKWDEKCIERINELVNQNVPLNMTITGEINDELLENKSVKFKEHIIAKIEGKIGPILISNSNSDLKTESDDDDEEENKK